MQKIPTLYLRDFAGTLGPPGKYVLRDVHPECEWVIAGEGFATQKLDGTAVLVSMGEVFKRREVKPGKAAPDDFMEVYADEKTGKRFGWVPFNPDDPGDRWLREGLDNGEALRNVLDGTYELVGPKVQGNHDGYSEHTLVQHGTILLPDAPTDYDALATWLRLKTGVNGQHVEGVVWHHEDGRMAKIKGKDFPTTKEA